MVVASITKLKASSPKSFEDAVEVGLKRATLTVRGISDLKILEQTAKVKNGRITEYWVSMEIGFTLEK